MAGSGSLTIDPAHLEGGDGTVSTALRLWSIRNPPCTYNTWQSLYFQLVRQGLQDEVSSEELARETPAERQQRIKAMYSEMQTEAHGPEYAVLAAQQSAVRARATARAPPQTRPVTITEVVAPEAPQ